MINYNPKAKYEAKEVNGTWFLLCDGLLVKGGFQNKEAIDRWMMFFDSLPSEAEQRLKSSRETILHNTFPEMVYE